MGRDFGGRAVSRALEALSQDMLFAVNEMLQLCKAEGLVLLVTSTLRTNAEQAALYCQGRDEARIERKADELHAVYGRQDLASLLMAAPRSAGRVVTMAGPGQSLHQYGMAIDCVPLVGGKPMWQDDHPLWQVYGKAVEGAGLEWAGRWMRMKEYPHAQLAGKRWEDMIRNGK